MNQNFFTYYKLDNAPGFYNSSCGEYCTFSASSLKPCRNGLYIKIYCQAFDENCQKIKKMKLHKGSVIDMVTEMMPYIDKAGHPQTIYMIMALKFSEFFEKPEEKIPEKTTIKTQQPQNRLMETAFMLDNSPFA